MLSPLQTYRLRREMTQEALAALLGIAASTLSLVESGRIGLPAHAAASFERLQRSIKPGGEGSAGNYPAGFSALREKHLLDSNDYLRRLKKEKGISLDKQERKLERWTLRYNAAMAELQLAEIMIAKLTTTDPLSPNIEGYQFQRAEALVKLTQISEQKPEITMVKIAGLKQELRSIKALLGKKKRSFLGMPETGSKLGPPVPAIEQQHPLQETPVLPQGPEATQS